MALLRPHLRTCLVCRARLRDYRAAPARVAAMTPPVAVGGLLAAARDLLHAASAWLGERSAAAAVRWHQAAELAAGQKIAAAVASSAALAGGGAAAVATVEGGDRPAAVRLAPGSSAVTSPPIAPSGNEGAETRGHPAAGRPTGQAASDETSPADRDPAPAPRSADAPSMAPESAGEFTPDSAAAEPAATRPGQPDRLAGSEPQGGGGEFAP